MHRGRRKAPRRRLLRRRSALRHTRRFRRSACASPCTRAQGAARLRAQPHVRPASVVRPEPFLARQSKTGLVHLARSRPRWLRAQQLDQRFRRLGVGVGRGHRPILLSRLPEGAGGPQLAQSRRASDDVRRDALLVRPRRRRVQAVGRYGDEATLLALAAVLEAETKWADRHPSVSAWAGRPSVETPSGLSNSRRFSSFASSLGT